MFKSLKSRLLSDLSYYRELRAHNLTSPRYRHTLLLLFWCVYGIAFSFVEKTERDWTWVEWPLVDDLIPFCEWFVFPYMFWFGALVFMVALTFLLDVPTFRKLMYFIMLTYSTTLVIYLIWPTAQALRPDLSVLGRDNALARFMAGFYNYDTPTPTSARPSTCWAPWPSCWPRGTANTKARSAPRSSGRSAPF